MELLEREKFLDALVGHLTDACAGRGRFVFLGGEAGVGKTSLTRSFVDRLGTKVRVLWAACDGLFTPGPLGPVADLARQSSGRLTELLDRDRPELFAAVLDELSGSPSVTVLEDLHWADEATLDLVRFLARRIDQPPVGLVPEPERDLRRLQPADAALQRQLAARAAALTAMSRVWPWTWPPGRGARVHRRTEETMDETYRMLGREHALDLEREARKRDLAAALSGAKQRPGERPAKPRRRSWAQLVPRQLAAWLR